MSLFQRQIFGTKKGITGYNLYISGVAGTISSASLLAAQFINYPSGSAFSAANILNFTITGSDIKCYVNADYEFSNVDTAFTNNLNIKSFEDYDRCKRFYSRTFAGAEFLRVIYAKNAAKIFQGVSLQRNYTLENIYLPNCVNYGNVITQEAIFSSAVPFLVGCKIYSHTSMQTINSGGIEGDLAQAISKGANVIYVANNTAPNSISDLSVGTIYSTALQLNFTTPSSTNAIDYYEVYVNGVYKQKIYTSGVFIYGLSYNSSQSITLNAVDIYYNKSTSNVLSTSTNTSVSPVISNIVASYRFNSDLVDQKNGYNGTGTSITYKTAKSGNGAFLNGTSSKIEIADNTDFSFTNGTNDIAGSCFMSVKFESTVDQWLINKREVLSTGEEWQLIYYSGKLSIYFFSSGASSSFIVKEYTFTPVVGIWYNIAWTYSGNGSHTGIKLYVNASSVGTGSLTGTYTKMSNTTSKITIGKAGWSTSTFYLNATIDNLTIFKNYELSSAEITDIHNSINGGRELI